MRRGIGVVVVALAGLGGIVSSSAASHSARISARGVGSIALGARASTLQAHGLIGRVGVACELDPGSRGALLSSPLKGSVELTRGTPAKVSDVYLSGGSARTSRGIGIGSGRGATLGAYPRARHEHSTEQVFGITLLVVPRSEGGPFQLGLSTRTHRVTAVGIPSIPFCD